MQASAAPGAAAASDAPAWTPELVAVELIAAEQRQNAQRVVAKQELAPMLVEDGVRVLAECARLESMSPSPVGESQELRLRQHDVRQRGRP